MSNCLLPIERWQGFALLRHVPQVDRTLGPGERGRGHCYFPENGGKVWRAITFAAFAASLRPSIHPSSIIKGLYRRKASSASAFLCVRVRPSLPSQQWISTAKCHVDRCACRSSDRRPFKLQVDQVRFTHLNQLLRS